MYKFIGLLLVVFGFNSSFATQVEHKYLSELVQDSDVIVEVDVADVYGKNRFDAIVRNPDMQTGPGLDNTILLYVCSKKVLLNFINTEVPKCFEVSIWNKWHSSLDSFLEYQSKTVILLLKGNNLERVHPGYFILPMEKNGEILELIKKRDTVKWRAFFKARNYRVTELFVDLPSQLLRSELLRRQYKRGGRRLAIVATFLR